MPIVAKRSPISATAELLLGNSSSKTFDGREIEVTGNYSHSVFDALMPLVHIGQRFIASGTLASAGISCRHVSVCLSVRPSAISRFSTETAKGRIMQTTPRDSPGSLVFERQKSRQNSHEVTPNRDAKCR